MYTHNVYYLQIHILLHTHTHTHTRCMRLQTAPTLDRMLGNKPTLPLWVEDDDGEDGDGDDDDDDGEDDDDGDDDIEDHQSNADFVLAAKILPWFQNGHQ